jgi:hypothetical protein
MTARQHHYVPQFYLKGFTYNRRKPKLFCFDFKDRKPFETTPENVAVERDFNRIDIDGYGIDAFEKTMAVEETVVAEALTRVIKSRSLADMDDRFWLFHLIATLATKTPPMRENMRSFHEQISRHVLGILTSSKEIWDHQTKKATEAGFMTGNEKVTFESMKDFAQRGDYIVEVSTEAHLAREMEMQKVVFPRLASRKWTLLTAPAESAGFITSDHPASLMWSDLRERGSMYGPGFGLENTQVVFPISRELAMLGAFEIHEEEREADEDLVAKVNGCVMVHATRQIYGASRKFSYILAARSRVR